VDDEKCHKMMAGKPEGKRPLERPGHRWVDNIKINLEEIWLEGACLIYLVQNMVRWQALVNTVMTLWVP
jgi:hypothetical protein